MGREPSALGELNDSRRGILEVVKANGKASIPAVATALGVTHEAARKQIVDLQRSGWLSSDCSPEEAAAPVPGRPPVQYCLTQAGENLFPKHYGDLTVRLLDLIGNDDALAALTDEVVRRLRSHPGSEMDAVRNIYGEDDDYTSVEQRGNDFVLIERNCPYLDVAVERPAICSTTVSALRRFTGREVVRERRFQDGDGRCEFHVRSGRRGRNVRFEREPER